MLDALEAGENLEQARLVMGAMPEVARDRAGEVVDVLAQEALERREPPVARRRVGIGLAGRRLALERKRLAHPGGMRVEPLHRVGKHRAGHSNPALPASP